VNDVLEDKLINPTGNSKVSFDVKDPKNDNSSFISYYQTNIGNEDLKEELTFKIVSKYLA